MSKITNNESLVNDAELSILKEYDKLISNVVRSMKDVSKEIIEASNALDKMQASAKANAEAAAKLESLHTKAKVTTSELYRLEQEKSRYEQKIIAQKSEEALEVEKLRQKYNDYSRTLRNQAKEANAVEGSTNKLRARLNQLLQTYDSLGNKDSIFGKSLKKEIGELTEEIKNAEFGTKRFSRNVGNYAEAAAGSIENMKESLERMIKEYNKLGNRNSDPAKKLKNEINSLKTEIDKASNSLGDKGFGGALQVFTGNLMTSALNSLTILAMKVKEFVFEGVEMATTFEGVKYAFKQLDKPNLLANLRKETKGTINDFRLMQAAVQAKDYKIPLEGLPTLLKFVQNQVQRTGGDFEKLTEQIVVGIGRESTARLDDFALSAEIINTEMKKMGGNATFAEAAISLVSKKLEEQGEQGGEAATKAAQAQVKWENAQLNLGEKLLFVKNIWSGLSGEVADFLNKAIEKYMPTVIDGVEKFINKLVDLYNNFAYLRLQVQGVIFILKTLFEGAKQGVKQFLAGVNLIADAWNSIGKGDFQGVKTAYLDFFKDMGNASEVFTNNTIDNFKAMYDAIENPNLKKIDLKGTVAMFSKMNKNNDDKDKKGGGDKKEAAAEKKAANELSEYMLSVEVEKQKAILSNNKKTYQERTIALEEFLTSQKQLIDEKEANQLKDSSLTESQKKLIVAKAQDERNKITEEGEKYRSDVLKDYGNEQMKRIEDFYKESEMILNDSQSLEERELADRYAQGLINKDEYEKEKTNIAIDYERKRFEASLEGLNAILAISELSEDARLAIEKKIGDERVKFEKSVNDRIIKDQEKAADKSSDLVKKAAEERKKVLNEIQKEMLNLAKTFLDADVENNINALDKKKEENTKWRDDEKESIDNLEKSGAISKEEAESRKAAIDRMAQEREKRIEEEKKRIKIEQAKREKAFSIMSIAMNTAAAIMKNTATLGLLLSSPVNVATGILGAVQAATVLATPLPKYKYGTKDHKGGFAVVGDGYKSEAVQLPDGGIFRTPDTPTIMSLPEHTVVHPDYEKYMKSIMLSDTREKDKKIVVLQENKRGLDLQRESLKSQKRSTQRIISSINNLNKTRTNQSLNF